MARNQTRTTNANESKVVRAAQTGASSKRGAQAAPDNANNGEVTGGDDNSGMRTVHVLKYQTENGNDTVEHFTRFSKLTSQMRDLLSQGLSVTVERTQARVTQTVEIGE